MPAPDARPASAQLAIEQERTEQEQERTERTKEREKTGRWKAFLDTIPILATLATVMVAVFSSLQSQQQYRDSQASERFQSAVEMLAGENLTTRIGGIALLGQVAQTGDERRETAVRLLATHLRVHSPVTEAGRQQPISREPAAEEVRAVFAALQYRGDVKNIDLGRISARNLTLGSMDLTGLVFARSDLSGSMLDGSNLSQVTFKQATLKGVNFSSANLKGADFQDADLTDADFKNADLSGADLTSTTGLKAAMLAGAKTDSQTKLPSGIAVSAAEQSPPATPEQPAAKP